jgi:hypothetical protein
LRIADIYRTVEFFKITSHCSFPFEFLFVQPYSPLLPPRISGGTA